MQSVCLDEFGGEKAVRPIYQETNFIQHIFGGHLQFQVICAECSNVSIQLENMMDLTVEIHGDAGSLEEYLDQFTTKEWLHGVNMYKCDGVWALQDERVFYHHRRLLESKLLDLIRMLLED